MRISSYSNDPEYFILDDIEGFNACFICALAGAFVGLSAGIPPTLLFIFASAFAGMLVDIANNIDDANQGGKGVAIQFNSEGGTLDGGYFVFLNRSTGATISKGYPILNYAIGMNPDKGYLPGTGNDLDPSVTTGYYFNNPIKRYYPNGRTENTGYFCDASGTGNTRKICPPRR